MLNWRKIETAPRNGTEILTCFSGDSESFVVVWLDGSRQQSDNFMIKLSR